MPALTFSDAPLLKERVSQSYTAQIFSNCETARNSTIYPGLFVPGVLSLNQRALSLLDAFRQLADNWDGDDAVAPGEAEILKASMLIHKLELTGQKVFHVVPGPNGEVLVELREDDKSLEILFYPNRSVYVLFPKDGVPEQGQYDWDVLPKLLHWLHA
jgi:hypothetical protein